MTNYSKKSLEENTIVEMTCPNIVKERPDLNTLEIKNSWNYVNNGTIIDHVQKLVHCKCDRSGMFYVKSAYDVIVKEESDLDRIWQKILKLIKFHSPKNVNLLYGCPLRASC